MSHILILTTEPLPLPEMPTTGAGLRAWGLARGLQNAGHDVRLLMPSNATTSFGNPPEPDHQPTGWPLWTGCFSRNDIQSALRRENPDILILQHWGLMPGLGELDCPLAIDLAGPHLLERMMWGSPDPQKDLGEKLDALRRADFLTCSGQRQRHYFLPHLSMAGWDITDPDVLPVIPYSLAPATQAPVRHDRFIYGGFFLPWQDPAKAIETTLEVFDKTGKGELLFIGGQHPTHDVSRGQFEPLLQRLKSHPRVNIIAPVSFDRYVDLLSEGGIALDLMARNPERELAFTTRTVVYLAHGLPVIHDDYSELAQYISEFKAGWTLDPKDPWALHKLLCSILEYEIELQPYADAAQALVKSKLHWDHTIEPLTKFCDKPSFRQEKSAIRLGFEEQKRRLDQLESNLCDTNRELKTLKGKRWVRWGLHAMGSRSWLRLPMACLALLISLILILVFLVSDVLPSRSHSQSQS
jgi:hypothetical protein